MVSSGEAIRLLLLMLILLPEAAALSGDYSLEEVSVFVDMDKKTEQFFVNLTCTEGRLEYFEFAMQEQIHSTSQKGTKLRHEMLPNACRIYFENPISRGESYAFYIDFGIEARYLEENTLYYRSISFPKQVRKFSFAVKLPENVFPEVATRNQTEITSWKTATTLPPNEISIGENRVTLIWKKALRANEKFEIGLIYPERKPGTRLYLGVILASIAIFSLGFALAWKKRKRAHVHVFLTDEERVVVEFIRSRGGEVLQEEIWKSEIGFSRPKVSRIVADLEGRGILKRQQHKKTFKVSLVKY